MSAGFKRRNYFINRELQGQHVFSNYLTVLAIILLFIALFFFFTSDAMTIVYSQDHLQLERTPFVLLKKLIWIAWIVLIPGGIWITVKAVFASHRTAGPLFKLEKTIDSMILGEIGSKAYLRPKDFCGELAGKINELNAIYAQKIGAMAGLAAQINTIAGGAEDEATKLRKIELLSSELNQAAEFFTVVNDQ